MSTKDTADERNSKPKALPRILCAEDNQLVRDSLAAFFATAKLSVVFAVDGQHALDLLSAQPDAFDLLITDHQMPRLDGLALVRHLRQRNFSGQIIVFSSDLHPHDRAAYQALQVRDLLNKPEHRNDLLKLIEQLHYDLRRRLSDSSSTSPPNPSNA